MKVPINSLDNGNAQQKDFLKQIDAGRSPLETDYYRRYKDYRNKTTSNQRRWTEEELVKYMYDYVNLYEDIKKNGMNVPIKVRRKDNRIVDGNHRHEILRHLGYEEIEVNYKG